MFFCTQILETIPVSEEVSELVEKLGNFYSEVDGAGDQVEQNEVDKRAFTRPFADCAGERVIMMLLVMIMINRKLESFYHIHSE